MHILASRIGKRKGERTQLHCRGFSSDTFFSLLNFHVRRAVDLCLKKGCRLKMVSSIETWTDAVDLFSLHLDLFILLPPSYLCKEKMDPYIPSDSSSITATQASGGKKKRKSGDDGNDKKETRCLQRRNDSHLR